MIITCPNCATKFNLPDGQAREGVQLRCTVCKHVFAIADTGGRMPGRTPDQTPGRPADPMPDQALGRTPDDLPGSAPAPAVDSGGESPGAGFGGEEFPDELGSDGTLSLEGGARKRKKRGPGGKGCLVALILLLLLVGGALAAWLFAPDLIRQYLPLNLGDTSAPAVVNKDMVSRIVLKNVRQYTIDNEKMGQIAVIEGKAVNEFDDARELIKVEAVLYDKDGKELSKKQQLAGTTVSLFQLQILGEKELEQALSNRIEILSNNTNVPPNGEVPFMVVFYAQPEGAAEFGIKVVDARLPPKS
jgi:predicted Zn finger-like uncharacterized protein